MSQPDLNVEDTAALIEEAAQILHRKADALARMAQDMRAKKDLAYAAEALNEIVELPRACRVDLLVLRPLRALGFK